MGCTAETWCESGDCMNVNPGELNKRIEIIQMETANDGEGFPVQKEKVIRRPWARVSQHSAKEKFMAGREMSDVKMRFLIRYGKTELNEDMMIRYKKELYEIKMIHNYLESNEYMEIIGERKA